MNEQQTTERAKIINTLSVLYIYVNSTFAAFTSNTEVDEAHSIYLKYMLNHTPVINEVMKYHPVSLTWGSVEYYTFVKAVYRELLSEGSVLSKALGRDYSFPNQIIPSTIMGTIYALFENTDELKLEFPIVPLLEYLNGFFDRREITKVMEPNPDVVISLKTVDSTLKSFNPDCVTVKLKGRPLRYLGLEGKNHYVIVDAPSGYMLHKKLGGSSVTLPTLAIVAMHIEESERNLEG